jgi:tetratricopeptide (TPR) repeat protein
MSIFLLALSSRSLGGGQLSLGTNIDLSTVRNPAMTSIGTLPKLSPERDQWQQEIQHALNLESVGDFAEAERTLAASVHTSEQPGSDPMWLPTALDRLGFLNWNLGRTRQAEQVYLRSADLWRTRFGPSSLGLATTLADLAWVYVALENPSHAKTLWQHSLEIRTVILGPYHPGVAQVYGYMAVGAFAAHRFDETQSFCQQALRIYERSGKVPGETDQVLSSLASVKLRQGRTLEAIQLINEAIHLEETATHPVVRLVAGYYYNLALAESTAARPADSESHFQRALSLLAAPPYATQTLRCNVLNSYAQFLSRAGRKKEARTVQRQASNITQLIRRQSYDEYVADVSSFR